MFQLIIIIILRETVDTKEQLILNISSILHGT
jgi:hypothetical protein